MLKAGRNSANIHACFFSGPWRLRSMLKAGRSSEEKYTLLVLVWAPTNYPPWDLQLCSRAFQIPGGLFPSSKAFFYSGLLSTWCVIAGCYGWGGRRLPRTAMMYRWVPPPHTHTPTHPPTQPKSFDACLRMECCNGSQVRSLDGCRSQLRAT